MADWVWARWLGTLLIGAVRVCPPKGTGTGTDIASLLCPVCPGGIRRVIGHPIGHDWIPRPAGIWIAFVRWATKLFGHVAGHDRG